MINKIKKFILVNIAICMLSISIFINTKDYFQKNDKYEIKYEYVNIKDMATSKIKEKNIINQNSNIIKIDKLSNIKEVELPEIKNSNLKEVELEIIDNSQATIQNAPVWRLPLEVGRVTQYPSYGHMAYDITSYRTYNEVIFPIGNGIISGIYTDSAGAKIITVRHEVNGKVYSSQYVHLSRYAEGVYVGKTVTVNDALGYMGSTGRSTGPHLHIAVLECGMFDPNDANCSTLGKFYNYTHVQYNQGFRGLGSLIDVPFTWNGR